ncbi:acyl-homoserine-lactone synthase [Novosphingobium resinovorum]|uniref:Acyl-homoserine-lactone synthase n=1 Tax=Novosphingobium resinovorum TaxID=158500 RepID=A0A1D8A2R6_9SPHN|nr:acyl-homoserine-lactone synthase [Novosphingobium resinovorum]AOR76394.1 autoinducer synthase [Novosphingobium resinovorum]
MLCCHVLTARSAFIAGSDQILSAMFEARKSVFVDLLKWDVPVIAGCYEIDQFDNAHAQYLVLTDGKGRHMASARLLPTTREHILGGLYPQLCSGAVPHSPTIREITRFCIERTLTTAERRAARDTLVARLADHALAEGITAYTAVADAAWCAKIHAFGWRCAPLGDVHTISNKRMAALRIEIDADTPRLLREAGIGAQDAAQHPRAMQHSGAGARLH